MSDRLSEIRERMLRCATGDDDTGHEVGDWRWLIAEVERLTLSTPAAQPVTFTEDPEGYWGCSCGGTWRYEDDGPGENDWHYCPRCGARITSVVPYVEDDDEV